ncbi:homoserine O-succinyltransferase [Frankia sp. Allo2]|nr:homoserine O-succinyltransferase [Frankia sp. Allo2]
MAATGRGTGGQQFDRLIRNAANSARVAVHVDVVDLDPTTSHPHLPGSRSDWQRIASFDALVVTGAQPQNSRPEKDPGYPVIERILDLSRRRNFFTVFSCLSAHLALHQMCGVQRRRLAHKRVGVLDHQTVARRGPLTVGLPDVVTMPHSRWNTVDRDELVACGVRLELLTGGSDWAVATSQDGVRQVFVQGHPEYLPDMLLREYRRDVRVFLTDPDAPYPPIPEGYLADTASRRLAAFARRARSQRSPTLATQLPTVGPLPDVARRWTAEATAMTANWIRRVADGSTGRINDPPTRPAAGRHQDDLVLANGCSSVQYGPRLDAGRERDR